MRQGGLEGASLATKEPEIEDQVAYTEWAMGEDDILKRDDEDKGRELPWDNCVVLLPMLFCRILTF